MAPQAVHPQAQAAGADITVAPSRREVSVHVYGRDGEGTVSAPNQFRPWTARANAELLQMWHRGHTVMECAKYFGRTTQAITDHVAKLQKRGNPVQPVMCVMVPVLGRIS